VRPLGAIGTDHLVYMITIITISITIVVSDDGELEFPLCELCREFPITDTEVLLGDEPPEAVGEDQEAHLILRKKFLGTGLPMYNQLKFRYQFHTGLSSGIADPGGRSTRRGKR